MKYIISITFLSLTLLTACNTGGTSSSSTSYGQDDEYPSYAPKKDPAQEMKESQENWDKLSYEKAEKQFQEWDKKNGVPHVPLPRF